MSDEEQTPMYAWFVVVGFLGLLVLWQYQKWQEEKRDEEERKARAALREKMKLEPRVWTLKDMAPYRGVDKEKPIVLCAGGHVFNVWRGWEFYCPEGPYHQLVATDASRLLAKDQLELETPEQRATPLRKYERSRLMEWMDAFDWKYERVGTLLNWNESVLSGLPYEENPSNDASSQDQTKPDSTLPTPADSSSSPSSSPSSPSSSPSSSTSTASTSISPSAAVATGNCDNDDDHEKRQVGLRMRLPGAS